MGVLVWQEVRRVSDDMSRRLDILFAFVRQSVRESTLGFGPNSGTQNHSHNHNPGIHMHI